MDLEKLAQDLRNKHGVTLGNNFPRFAAAIAEAWEMGREHGRGDTVRADRTELEDADDQDFEAWLNDRD